jgi:hypothetical protein
MAVYLCEMVGVRQCGIEGESEAEGEVSLVRRELGMRIKIRIMRMSGARALGTSVCFRS